MPDVLFRWVTTVGTAKEAELNNLFNDVVVRGFYHEVLTIVGYLNASTLAEQLETTKSFMRNSSRMSIDQSYEVYPVSIQPSNWAQMLAPNTDPVDLLQSKSLIQQQLNATSQNLQEKQMQLAKMEAASNPQKIAALKTQVSTANDQYDKVAAPLIY